jgi:hypothetical protein
MLLNVCWVEKWDERWFVQTVGYLAICIAGYPFK